MSDRTLQQDVPVSELKEAVKDFSARAGRLKQISGIDRRPLRLNRRLISRMGKDETRLLLWNKLKEAARADIYDDIHELIRLTHESYEQFKRIIGSRYSTHRYITDQALRLVAADPAAFQRLLGYSTYPDESESDMRDLVFEGHFYGKTFSGGEGNFLNNLFPEGLLAVLEMVKKLRHGFDEDIREHAVMNFAKNCARVRNGGPEHFHLGVAAHYLQDLTAPHHVGNYPAVPYVDHYFFEKYASLYVHDNPQFVIAKADYDNFKGSLTSNPDHPERFALEIHHRATEFIPYIATGLHAESPGTPGYENAVDDAVDTCNSRFVSGSYKPWDDAINNALPLAVYATAYLFEKALA